FQQSRLQLFEAVEVVVAGRGAEGHHIGALEAVQEPYRLIAGRDGSHVLRLLPSLVAADVDVVRQHSRSGLEDLPGIADDGDVLQIFVGAGAARAESPLLHHVSPRIDRYYGGDRLEARGRRRLAVHRHQAGVVRHQVVAQAKLDDGAAHFVRVRAVLEAGGQ